VTPVVECSSSKHKALSLNLTAKINKYIKHYGNRFGSKCLMQELGRELGNLLAENNGLDFFFFMFYWSYIVTFTKVLTIYHS
jgi:hypothetical protein